jgi:hypothetical protein
LNEGYSIVVHDVVVAGPLGGSNMPLAKGLVAERARLDLGDPQHKHSLMRICDCGHAMQVDDDNTAGSGTPTAVDSETTLLSNGSLTNDGADDTDIKNTDPEKILPADETDEGFARLAKSALRSLSPSATTQEVDGEDVEMAFEYDAHANE